MLTRANRYFWSILFVIQSFIAIAQPHCSVEHFSFNNGLNQSTIKSIYQDKKGFIWLGTYDGLVRYDGYDFKNFKVPLQQTNISLSNRINRVLEDKYARLWIMSPDGIYCFIPGSQKYWGLENINTIDTKAYATPNIQVNPSGKVWFQTETAGCICIEDSLFNTRQYTVENKALKSNKVNEVYEDSEHNSWILTDKGISLIPQDSNTTVSIILKNSTTNPTKDIAVYSALEIGNEIWFGADKGVIWRYSKQNKSFYEFSLNITSHIRNFIKLNDSSVFIQSFNDGFFSYNIKSGQLQTLNTNTLTNLDTNKLEYVYIDYPNKLWFTTLKQGIYKYDFETSNLKYFDVEVDDNTINRYTYSPFVFRDKSENIWVHPKGGGFSFYNKAKDTLEPFNNSSDDTHLRFSNLVYATCIDNQGNMWLSSRSNGLEKITFSKNEFSRIAITDNKTSFSINNVRSIYQDRSGYIWVSTKAGAITIYDSEFNKLGNLSPDGTLTKAALWHYPIYTILEDKSGTIWMGSRGGGLYKLQPTNTKLSFTVTQLQHNKTDIYSLSNNNIYALFQDTISNIWVGTLGGGINLLIPSAVSTPRFYNINNLLPALTDDKCYRVRCITQSKDGTLYAGTSGGLISWESDFLSPEKIIFNHNKAVTSDKNSLSNNEIFDILATTKGDIYIATFGGGINKIISYNTNGKPKEFKTYSSENGLTSDLTLDLQEDLQGDIWVTTENNLLRLNNTSETFETYLGATQLLGDRIFSEVSSCQLKSGKLAFGYSNGLVLFTPEKIVTNSYIPKLTLLAMQVFNKPLLRTDGIPYNGTIDDIKAVELKHDQNFFTIAFSALDFTNSRKIQYAYMLEGFDLEWNYTNTLRIANYTNIPAGDYIFRVKSTNSNGVWVDNEKVLSITIKPSFWATPLAYLLYTLLILILFYLIQKNILTIYKLKNDVKLQKEISDMKLKFFIDISHEIRTPLTMITAPIEYLINDTRTPNEIKKQLNFISQSTNRLLKLVNQILDFRRLQSKQLKIQETNLGLFTKNICADFIEMAEEQHINFNYTHLPLDAPIWVDQDALEKVIMNLLSNAFKYIKDGDSITVSINRHEKTTTLSVTDNGQGIEKSKQKELFLRFATFNDDKKQPSTGIGLSIVKEIADKHSAKVTVTSEPGIETIFSVEFTNGNNHFNKTTQLVEHHENKEETINNKRLTKTDNKLEKTTVDERKTTILIVEDDTELRSFITSILDDKYTIIEAENGAIGLTIAIKNNPDIIISDIMMPEMDGITLLKQLRHNPEISHIPVILLTAKTNIESKLEGLSYGADDYITKPFSVPYFTARIDNLLQQRKRLHAIFSSDNSFENSEVDVTPNLITSKDEALMKNVINCINTNLDRNDFSVEELAKMVGLSRSSFYNKMKSLTGSSPVEFIRNHRLKNAAKLITQNNFLIKEVCYMSGFTDTKYFTKCFKAKYDMTPIEYRNQKLG